MEAEFDFMNFNFNQEMNIDMELPFGNWSESENYNNQNDNFFSFLKINYNSSPQTEKKFMQGEEIIEKLNEFEKSYSNIIQKSIIASPTQNLNDKIKGNLDSNLILAEGTLPGLLISIMYKENAPVPQNFLLGKIGHKFDKLRKLNGAKYRGDINKVLKSTLCSSGLFIQTEDNKYYFKEKEALNYIIKVTEKVLTKKLEKNIKDSKTTSTAKTSGITKSASSVNNNFNSTLSISSFGTNNLFGNNKISQTENSLSQKDLFNSIIPANKKINKNKKSTKTKIKCNDKNNSTNNSFKDNNNICGFILDKGKVYKPNSTIINNNVYNESFNQNSAEVSNFNYYNCSTKNLNPNPKESEILASNLIDDNNLMQDDSNTLNNNNTKNVKKRKKSLSFTKRMDYKICKVYNILDDLLAQCRKSNDLSEGLNNSFKDINSSLELLQKIGDHNKVIGILMCFKYFKSMINKYTKISHKKKNKEHLLDISKLNTKLDVLKGKITVLEQKLAGEKTDMQIDEYL